MTPYTAQYEVTAKLQDQMLRQYFFSVLLRSKLRPRLLNVAAFIAMIGGTLVLGSSVRPWAVGFVAVVFLFLIGSWVAAYFNMKAQGRSGLKVMEHPRVEIILDDEAVTYKSSTGTRRHAWPKIERIAETKDFVILMQGQLPLLMLPKNCFEPKALSFLQSHGDKSKVRS